MNSNSATPVTVEIGDVQSPPVIGGYRGAKSPPVKSLKKTPLSTQSPISKSAVTNSLLHNITTVNTNSLLQYLTALARDFIKYISTSDIFSIISSKTNRISQDNEQIMTVGGIMILISVLLLLAEY
jgi:hypothetical protein